MGGLLGSDWIFDGIDIIQIYYSIMKIIINEIYSRNQQQLLMAIQFIKICLVIHFCIECISGASKNNNKVIKIYMCRDDVTTGQIIWCYQALFANTYLAPDEGCALKCLKLFAKDTVFYYNQSRNFSNFVC